MRPPPGFAPPIIMLIGRTSRREVLRGPLEQQGEHDALVVAEAERHARRDLAAEVGDRLDAAAALGAQGDAAAAAIVGMRLAHHEAALGCRLDQRAHRGRRHAEAAAELALVERAARAAQPDEQLPLLHRQAVIARDAIAVGLREQVHAPQAAERGGPRWGLEVRAGRFHFVPERLAYERLCGRRSACVVAQTSRAARTASPRRPQAARHGRPRLRARPGGRRGDRAARGAGARRAGGGVFLRASAVRERAAGTADGAALAAAACCATDRTTCSVSAIPRTGRSLPPRLTRSQLDDLARVAAARAARVGGGVLVSLRTLDGLHGVPLSATATVRIEARRAAALAPRVDARVAAGRARTRRARLPDRRARSRRTSGPSTCAVSAGARPSSPPRARSSAGRTCGAASRAPRAASTARASSTTRSTRRDSPSAARPPRACRP